MISRNNVRIFGDKALFVGILLLAASMPLSKFGMSLGEFTIAGGWLLGGDVKEKFNRVFRSPVVWILWGVYFLHLIGLWHCQDFKLAGDDLRIKAPLLLMPLFFAGMNPLTDKQYRILMGVLIGGVLASTLISLGVYLGWIHHKVNDIRDISIFISHIRLSLLCSVAIVLLARFITLAKSTSYKVLYFALIGWFICFMILLQSVTGLGILLAGLAVYLFVNLFSKKASLLAKGFGSVLLVGLLYGGYHLYEMVFVKSIQVIHVDATKLPVLTPRGNRYVHDTIRQDEENGSLVWACFCDHEMDSVWKQRSTLPLFEGQNRQSMRLFTLVRFLTSKGLMRDADGVAALSDAEIRAIENGTASINDLTENKFENRIRSLAWEYRQYHFNGYASGHSMTQRLEFWKNALYIIKQHPLTGVGTGNVKAALAKAYTATGSTLDAEWRLGPHNEYLLMGVLFGIGGILYFIFSLIAPWLILHKRRDFIYTAFLFIAICSMLTEDTLETQAGVTFYAFLNAIFLFSLQVRKSPDSAPVP